MTAYEALTFDDVLLEPQYSEVASRKDASTSTDLGGYHLNIPIVSANMDSITELAMAHAMHESGGLGILHRFADMERQVEWVQTLADQGKAPCPSVGIDEYAFEKAMKLVREGAAGICIDVAHGDNPRVYDLARAIKDKAKHVTLIAGNIATPEAFKRMVMAEVDVVKVGIGPGSLCTTRLVTGHGVPQFTAIQRCSDWRNRFAVEKAIIADGGIRNSGDIVKALAVGADAVMVGSLLAGTNETPSFKDELGCKVKRYRGMASADAQVGWKGSVSGVAEGESVNQVPRIGSVRKVIADLVAGIRSGMSYSGATTLDELKEAAIFVRVTANAVKENGAHFKDRK